ncbi:MAG: PH domain-containing protein [bacterium]|nr:PH domain-containing protein [bacterium]
MSHISNILETNEKVVWQGKINRKVAVMSHFITIIIYLAIVGFLFSLGVIHYTSNDQAKQINGSTIGMIVLLFMLFTTAMSFLSNMVAEYAITQKRVVLKYGLIGADFKSVYFDQIKNIMVDVGLIGKIFGTGTVNIDIGATETFVTSGKVGGVRTKPVYDVLKDIDNPYEVYKLLQQSLEGRKESLYSGRADEESLKFKK